MNNQYEQTVLIIGAGPGGAALLDIFSKEAQIKIIGIVDNNPNAPAITLARTLNIKVYAEIEIALKKCGDCIVFNMTHDETLAEVAVQYVGAGRVIGGQEAKFFWHMITRLQAVKAELLDNQLRLQAVISNVQEGILLLDPDGIIENANPAAAHIFGYDMEALIGKSISTLLLAPDQAAQDSSAWNELHRGKEHKLGQPHEIAAISKDGVSFPLEINLAEMKLDGLTHFVGIMRDITDRKVAEQTLTQLALFDQLTGLPNRRNFFDKLDFSASTARRNKTMLAVLFIDLDGFKTVNDTYGHAMGDYLLKEVARRLLKNIRESDVAARMGGDEFTIVLNNVQSANNAVALAEKFIKVINQPVKHDKITCTVGASIGMAIYSNYSDSIKALLDAADSAMYQAKAGGKNRLQIAKL